MRLGGAITESGRKRVKAIRAITDRFEWLGYIGLWSAVTLRNSIKRIKYYANDF